MSLPVPPYGLTLGWVDQDAAREALALHRARCVLKAEGELWTVSGPLRLAEGYAKQCKRTQGWTVIKNCAGLAS